MGAYFKSITAIGKFLYPSLLWNIQRESKTIYLTFDDGPIPGITPLVLELLKKYDARATFFCIGDNVRKHPAVYKQILAEGHTTGNHTYNHLNGWKTPTRKYLENILLAEEILKKENSKSPEGNQNFRSIEGSHFSEIKTSSEDKGVVFAENYNDKYFRPPYGKITPAQIKEVQNLGYKIVMWDVISGDFDTTTSSKACFNTVIKLARPGSLIVFHDSLKAWGNLQEVLPRVLEHYKNRGYEFRAL